MIRALRRLISGMLFSVVATLTTAPAAAAPGTPVPPPIEQVTPIQLDWSKTLFFHWGSSEANALLLSLGGYDFRGRSHNADLGDGRSADYNEAVNSKLLSWYAVQKKDAAGTGFYLSPIPLDTSSFGPDVLVAEFVDAPKDFAIPAAEELNLSFKAKSDAALAAGKLAELPLATTYETNHWTVVSRAPRAGEPRIRFRPPGPDDVERAYQSILAQLRNPNPYIARRSRAPLTQVGVDRQFLFAMNYLAKLIHGEAAQPMTRSSDIFLRRLFFDRMDRALHEEILPRAIARRDAHVVLYAYSLLQVYEETIPGDPRTVALETFTRKYRDWISPAQIALLARENEIDERTVAIAISLLPPDWVNHFLDQLFALPQSHKRPLAVANFLFGLKRTNPALFDAAKSKKLEDRLSALLANPPPGDLLEYGDIIATLVTKLSADPRAKDWMVTALRAMGSQDVAFTCTPTDTTIKIVRMEKDVFPALLASVNRADYLAAMVDMSVGFFDTYLPADPNAPKKPWTTFDFKPMVEWWAWLRAADADSYRRLAARIEARMKDPALVRRWLDVGGHVAWRGFVRGQVDDGDVKHMMMLAHEMPSLRALVVDRLVQDFQREDPVEDGLAARQLAAIERQRDLLAHERPDLLPVMQQALIARTNSDSGADLTHILRAVLPDGLPRAQADLLKIFPLVDPIFVSEKIRQGVVSPQLSFNFPYRADGKKFTQPAWENFIETWDFIANSTPALVPGRGAAVLARADALLLDGYVDRTITLEGGNWDRSKYKTLIRGTDWQKWDVEKNRAEFERYFHVTQNGADFIMVFKTATELGLKTPAPGETQADVILAEVIRQVSLVADPIGKAARILHLMTKMHPNENGNGRLGRLWASVVLLEAGYAVPAGLPSHDFLLSEERLRWEVRRAVVAGKFYERLMEKSVKGKVPTTRFWKDLYQGSAEEGVVTMTAVKFEDLQTLVREMESWSTPPGWAKDVAARLGEAISSTEKSGQLILQSDEMVRADLLVGATVAGRQGQPAALRCEAAF